MLYRILKIVCNVVFRLFWRWRIVGAEHFPKSGPVILVANHVSVWDPVIIAAAMPRNVRFMAKEELFQIPLLNSIITQLGSFPVKRGQADRGAIKQALEILAEGEVLGLFPEGTRSKTGELQKPHPGAALIALKSSAPVVPVACLGSNQPWKRMFHSGGFTVIIGPGQSYNKSAEHRLSTNSLEAVSNDMMLKISHLILDNISQVEHD